MNERLAEIEARLLAFANETAARADAAIEKQRELHRRAQQAESELAGKPTYAVLTDALEQLRACKSERHRLRTDNAFMRRERSRLQDQLRNAVADRSAATTEPVQRATPKDCSCSCSARLVTLTQALEEALSELGRNRDLAAAQVIRKALLVAAGLPVCREEED